MQHFVVTAVGADRPGIVAAVTTPLAELGCNLEDSSSTILQGHFAMMVVVAAPAGVSQPALSEAIQRHTTPLAVAITVSPVPAAAKPPASTHLLSVYGADRPGIVRDVAQFLAGRQIDITELQTRLLGRHQAVYVSLLEVAVPVGADLPALSAALEALSGQLGVEISLRPAETDTL